MFASRALKQCPRSHKNRNTRVCSATRTMAEDSFMFIAFVVDENGLADQCTKGNSPHIMDVLEKALHFPGLAAQTNKHERTRTILLNAYHRKQPLP